MPKRALIERRPWLLASLAAAIAYYLLADSAFPGAYLFVLRGVPFLLLAVYALLRHVGTDSRMLAAVMALAAAGVAAIDLFFYAGMLLLIVSHGMAISLYMRHRREAIAPSQKLVAVTLLVLTPVNAWLLTNDPASIATVTVYALALGGMAGAAWTSSFPRYRVGSGAVLLVLTTLLDLARTGPLASSDWPEMLVWPLYYLGQFLICTGVIQTLRKRA
jgi:hypothetical protein